MCLLRVQLQRDLSYMVCVGTLWGTPEEISIKTNYGHSKLRVAAMDLVGEIYYLLPCPQIRMGLGLTHNLAI